MTTTSKSKRPAPAAKKLPRAVRPPTPAAKSEPEASLFDAPAPEAAPVAATPLKSGPRAVKKRAPADLSGQYGRAEAAKAKRAPAAVPVEAPKAVLRGHAAREAREQRRQAMAVDDAVLQRLRGGGAPTTPSLVVSLPDAPGEVPAKRGRGFQTSCGKCGTARKFSTPATLCDCGAILVRL